MLCYSVVNNTQEAFFLNSEQNNKNTDREYQEKTSEISYLKAKSKAKTHEMNRKQPSYY